VQEEFAALGLDAGVVAAYGLILPEAILRAPRLGCLNVHASLLPRWRGAAPIERAILEGDPVTGVTIMQVDRGLDTGPILLSRQVPIAADTTASDLRRDLSELGAELMIEALAGLAAGTLVPRPQPADGVSYAHKLDRDEGRIDWSRPAERIERAVRALNPVPGVWFEAGGERIRVLAAEIAAADGAPGTILDHRLTVACGTHALRLKVVQRAGKGALEAAVFLRGFSLPPGTVLG
jgi:methionyl-tRNA formyltransferase